MFGRVKGIRLDTSLRTTVKKEAEEIAKERFKKALGRAHGVRIIKNIKLTLLMEKYLEYCKQNNRPSTYDRKRPFINHILAFFGDVPLSSITTERIEEFKFHRRGTVGPATVNREMAALKHALNLAVEWDYLEVSPAARVAKLKEPPGRVRYLNRAEADALLAACTPELYPVVATALHTGLRFGEILALEWGDVDLKRRQLRVVDSKNNDTRVVPINEILYNVLSSMRGQDGKIFKSRRGEPYRSVRTSFEKALKEAGIKNFTFHDLRRTFASWLAMEGVPMSTIGKLLGHKTPHMTMRYAHLAPEYLADVVELLTQNKHKPDLAKNTGGATA